MTVQAEVSAGPRHLLIASNLRKLERGTGLVLPHSLQEEPAVPTPVICSWESTSASVGSYCVVMPLAVALRQFCPYNVDPSVSRCAVGAHGGDAGVGPSLQGASPDWQSQPNLENWVHSLSSPGTASEDADCGFSQTG